MKELPKNKIRRSKIRQETKFMKKKQKKKEKEQRKREAEARGEDWRKPPLTLEDKRVQIFSDVFSGAVIPKVVVVPGLKATRMTYNFISELLQIIPNSVFYERKKSSLNQASVKAAEKGFTDVIFTEENRKQITGLFHVHLPHGPCAYYSIRSYVPCKKVVGHGRSTASKPEVILSHFTTQLGIRIARMLGALFALEPEYSGRQVVTLHNQRDFIFFRFHRYQFDDRGVKVSLQEQGPRFTLQLQQLTKGLPGNDDAEIEFRKKKKASKYEFFL
ncbi:Brix domain-containing protein F44G4.1 [Galdieria sulphuraria]|nr:Brix domain-containing protein F44G4.1 [Galdieria sulphuraria]